MLEKLDDALTQIAKMVKMLGPIEDIREVVNAILDAIEEGITKAEEALNKWSVTKCMIDVAAKPALVASLLMCPADETFTMIIKPGLD